jgi:nucleoside-diphosphate-sugar epimerase
MKVLVTGAFGTVGRQAVAELAARGHQVRCMDLPTRANRRAARHRRANRSVSVLWGDVRDPAAVRAAVFGQDVVVHLASILPPMTGSEPILAYQVNVEGTRNIVHAARDQMKPPRLVFASSVAVFGTNQQWQQPRTADDPVQATDAYSAHKLEGERLIRASGLRAAILRLGAIVPIRVATKDPREVLRAMFDVPLDVPVECLHARDAGRCLANAVGSDAVWGRTLLIGGGPSCRVRHRDLVDATMQASGVGKLPEHAFTLEPYYLHWMDTTDSQHLLDYQRTSFANHVTELHQSLRRQRALVTLLRPLVRRFVLSHAAGHPEPALAESHAGARSEPALAED